MRPRPRQLPLPLVARVRLDRLAKIIDPGGKRFEPPWCEHDPGVRVCAACTATARSGQAPAILSTWLTCQCGRVMRFEAGARWVTCPGCGTEHTYIGG